MCDPVSKSDLLTKYAMEVNILWMSARNAIYFLERAGEMTKKIEDTDLAASLLSFGVSAAKEIFKFTVDLPESQCPQPPISSQAAPPTQQSGFGLFLRQSA